MCCSQAVDSLVGFHEESMKKKRKNLHQGKVVVEKPQRKKLGFVIAITGFRWGWSQACPNYCFH